MKILIAHNTYRNPGGEDAAVLRDRDLLLARGHAVDLWLRTNERLDGALDRAMAGWRVAYDAGARDALAARIASGRPAILHVHNLVPRLSPAVLDAARAARIPVVMTLHNYRVACANGMLLRDGQVCELCLGGHPWHAVRYACYRDSRLASLAVARMIARARRERTWHTKVDRFIALSGFARAKLIEAGLPADRIAVRGNFVADPGPPDPAGLRAGFLFVGRLSPEKGIATLLAAAGRAGVALSLAGDGPLAGTLGGGVRWLGRLEPAAVARAMAGALALVVPSLGYEAFPLVVAEAYAAGLPVIASRLGALAELVEDEVTGLHAAPGDADGLALKLRWAEANRDAMARMGRAARTRYEATMAPGPAGDRLLAVYDQAMGRA